MRFKLDFEIKPFPFSVQPGSELFFAGSCFSENIASRFSENYFSVVSNTHGILYNPISIADAIDDCIQHKVYCENDLFYANESWSSFHHHSRFSDPDKNACLSSINESIGAGSEMLKRCDFLFITFGSAYIYRHRVTSGFVGNCHKIPQKEFEKVLLPKEEIVSRYSILIEKLQTINSNVKIIFTVSPVRYIRDGITENNLSKAILIQSVHELANSLEGCFYFPAYEIVNDELRDYRFFEEDMVHPNHLAINYVWERLSKSMFAEETLHFVSAIEQIRKAAEHRPFNPASEAHQKFKTSFLKQTEAMEQKYPHLQLQELKKCFL